MRSGLGETLRFTGFSGVTLHHRDGVQHLGGHGAGVGHAILAGPRELAHPTPQGHAGPNHQHQKTNDLQHQHGVAVDQHQQGACAHHQIAQAHGERGAHHGLHQRGVVREARQHFARLRGLKKRRALLQHMAIDRVAHIGGDALTQPGHRVKTHGGKHRQSRRHQEQLRKLTCQLGAAVWAAQALVDEQAQRPGESQRGASRQQQEQAGQGNAAFVRFDEGQQAGEGLGGGGGFGHLIFSLPILHLRLALGSVSIPQLNPLDPVGICIFLKYVSPSTSA